jgi:hypothetical protein
MISPLTALATIILITHAIALPQREASLNSVDLLKRQHDPFRLKIWEQPHCPGKPNHAYDFTKRSVGTFSHNVTSYQVSRNMTYEDTLYFYTIDPNGSTPPSELREFLCAKTVEQANPMAEDKHGASLLQKDHCYQFTGDKSARVSFSTLLNLCCGP